MDVSASVSRNANRDYDLGITTFNHRKKERNERLKEKRQGTRSQGREEGQNGQFKRSANWSFSFLYSTNAKRRAFGK